MYRRAISSLGCPDSTLPDFLALARRHGLTAVELRSLRGSTDLPAILAQETPPAASDPAIVALGTGLKLGDNGPAERQKFLDFVPWAEAWGIPYLRAFDGGKTADPADIERAAETLAWWRRERAARGWKVELVVETHDNLVTTAAVQALIAAAPGTRILWDTHHTWKKGGEDPVATWRALRPHIVHIHIKDSIGVPSAKHPMTYVLPGAGEFPMAPLKAELAATFDGIVSLEWEKLWHPYLPSLDEALTAAKDWW